MAGALREHGATRDEVLAELAAGKASAGNLPWNGPRMLRPSYFAGEDVLDVAQKAFCAYMSENWLYNRTSFPALGRIEDEVLTSLTSIFHAPAGSGGILTSGGTESLLLAVKIPASLARSKGGLQGRANLVVPRNTHPAIDKAAELMGLEVRRAPPGDKPVADVAWMANACDARTVLLVGSAPSYPFGVLDDLPAISALAVEKGIWMHVDACLGGMVLAFLEGAGRRPVAFDFMLPGVRSLSVDLHKFGYAVKGISALLLRDIGDAAAAKTVFNSWSAGLYGTPAVTATRSGGALASAWAVMRYLGRRGFAERTAKILDIRDSFIRALAAVGAKVVGDPPGCQFAFTIEGVDSLLLASELGKEGWYVSMMERPDAVQVLINARHEGMGEPFAKDVARLAHDIREGRRNSTGERAVYSM